MFPSLQEMHVEVGKPVLKLGTGASYRKNSGGESKPEQETSEYFGNDSSWILKGK